MYRYNGNEKITTDGRTYVKIHWNDGRTTQAVAKEGRFDFKLGLLLASAKKFVKYLDIDRLYTKLITDEAMKVTLSLLLSNIVGEDYIIELSDITQRYKNKEWQDCQGILKEVFS